MLQKCPMAKVLAVLPRNLAGTSKIEACQDVLRELLTMISTSLFWGDREHLESTAKNPSSAATSRLR
jgi:hypothetical protein